MLSRENRITRGSDFKSTVRNGRRVGSANSVVYVAPQASPALTRFGFIVAKSVGNSVVRHRTTRRLRAIGYRLLPVLPEGRDVIVRALPGCVEVDWDTLLLEIDRSLQRAIHPAAGRTTSGEVTQR